MARIPAPAPVAWSVGVDQWVFGDGNYDDFAVGQRVELALEATPMVDVTPVPDAPVHAAHRGADRYDVVGRVVHVDPAAWVLDVGVPAYVHGAAPDGVVAGRVVRTSIALGVDPFPYVARLHRLRRFPALVHTWDVTTIRRTTAKGTTSVARTDAWRDGLNTHYVLTCDLLPVPPQKTSVTAIP
ncbi:hypothetical protein ACFUMH_13880 [Cellulomonas sp. NPDC057328]|uniref:hypothetical protein n=1 Tax=Cellulomonas sp. NPDC057328 TaxID=3346101 RepID=UPI003632E4FB